MMADYANALSFPVFHENDARENAMDKAHMTEAEMAREIDLIIRGRKINVLFQPINDLRRQVIYAYEALSRGPSDSLFHSPDTLFDAALRTQRINHLETLCHTVGIEQFQHLTLPGKLFLNASPGILLQAQAHSEFLLEVLERHALLPENIVLEVTEQQAFPDYEKMRRVIEHYKSLGFSIAIDDLGAGYSGLRTWSELQPDYVKIDRHFIQNIQEDEVKQEFVRSICDIANGLDCRVVAEGIETRAEYQMVCKLGIQLGQGYYFSRPQSLPPVSISQDVFFCNSSSINTIGTRRGETLAGLIRNIPHVSPKTTMETVEQIFQQHSELTSVAVLDESNIPLGLIRRNQLLSMFAARYGRSLYGGKPVELYYDQKTLVLDRQMNIEHASQMVTDNMRMRIEDDFIITDGELFSGIGKVVDLLKKITELQVRNARYANPLTLLPGNVPIYEYMDKLIENRDGFVIAYCDLDNFKPYNDAYSYSKGDMIIKKLAEILSDEIHPEHDFVGHVGGDDFILIFKSVNWRQRCNAILRKFEASVLSFYSHEDALNRGVWAKDRQGTPQFYPVLSLSIGAVKPNLDFCFSHHDLAEMASDAKRLAKEVQGNSLYIDRREKPGGTTPADRQDELAPETDAEASRQQIEIPYGEFAVE